MGLLEVVKGRGEGRIGVGFGDRGKVERGKGGLGSRKEQGRLQRFTTRRASQRLESDDCSVASLRGR